MDGNGRRAPGGIFFVSLYLLLPAIMWTPLYRDVILMPCPPTTNASDYAQMDQVTHCRHQEYFIDDGVGGKMHVLHFRTNAPDSKHKLIVYHHGNAGNVGSRSAMFAVLLACGADLLAYDYTGYGKSSGKASLSHIRPVVAPGNRRFFVGSRLRRTARTAVAISIARSDTLRCLVLTGQYLYLILQVRYGVKLRV